MRYSGRTHVNGGSSSMAFIVVVMLRSRCYRYGAVKESVLLSGEDQAVPSGITVGLSLFLYGFEARFLALR